jgi:hypothetical protein
MRYVLLLTFLVSTGCAQPWSVVHSAGDSSRRVIAPEGGQYNLYEARNPVPLQCVMLRKGEFVGFEYDAHRPLTAFAGATTLTVVDRNCLWTHPWNITTDDRHAHGMIDGGLEAVYLFADALSREYFVPDR